MACWRESPFFDDRERAALHWAEAVNAIPLKDPSDEDFTELQSHFSENEIAEISYAIGAIKAWNTIKVSLRNQIPENLN